MTGLDEAERFRAMLDAFARWQATTQLEETIRVEEIHEHARTWFDLRKNARQWAEQRRDAGQPTSYREQLAQIYDAVRGLATVEQVGEAEHARQVARCRFIAAALRFQEKLDAIGPDLGDEHCLRWPREHRALMQAVATFQTAVDEHGWAVTEPPQGRELDRIARIEAAIDADQADIAAGRRPIDALTRTSEAA